MGGTIVSKPPVFTLASSRQGPNVGASGRVDDGVGSTATSSAYAGERSFRLLPSALSEG